MYFFLSIFYGKYDDIKAQYEKRLQEREEQKIFGII